MSQTQINRAEVVHLPVHARMHARMQVRLQLDGTQTESNTLNRSKSLNIFCQEKKQSVLKRAGRKFPFRD